MSAQAYVIASGSQRALSGLQRAQTAVPAPVAVVQLFVLICIAAVNFNKCTEKLS
jgi:hypothetical protein